jgi:hypothetical protein
MDVHMMIHFGHSETYNTGMHLSFYTMALDGRNKIDH